MLILRFALLCSLPGLLLPSPAAAQRWNDLEDALEGRELVLRPTFEGRRKVYLDGDDDRVFVLHRVKGCQDMPALVAALRARDARLGLGESSAMVA